jgi:hypothetical protein
MADNKDKIRTNVVPQGQKKSFVIMPDVKSNAFREHIAMRIEKAKKNLTKLPQLLFGRS